MSFTLGPIARAAGYRLFSHSSIGSTSSEALALARAGDRGRVWIAAREQTAGVGRRGREWQTPAGNLASSVFIVVETTATRAATLGFAAGLSLIEAIGRLAPHLTERHATNVPAKLALKWPNDVVTADGAKVAGILLQAESAKGSPGIGVVVGIGVNVATAPSPIGGVATSLSDLGVAIGAELLLTELAEAWVGNEQTWSRPGGLGLIRTRWMARATGIGENIAVRSDGETIRGRFETIDEDGCLIMTVPGGGSRRITAGEVHLGTIATAGAGG